MNHVDNYGKFYKLLKLLPGADKETLVRQFTNERTEHLRQMTDKVQGNGACGGLRRTACRSAEGEAQGA